MPAADRVRVLPWRRQATPADEALAPLLNAYRHKHPKGDTTLITKAYEVAEAAHREQRRKSGEPYISHPVAVATIVADLGLDDVTIASALLHDAVEDTGITVDDLSADFGATVASIVDGVTKLDRVRFDSKEAQQAASMRKMLVAMAKDWRVLIIKLADRLHNMRTIAAMPEWKQKRTAQETLDIYAPLAHRLGIQEVKWQLEDLAFAALHPKRYAEIEQMVALRAPERDIYLAQVLESVRERLAELRIDGEVTGRPKHLWSIYEKMVIKGKEFDEIYDLVGIRVLVDSVKDCYAALGSIHATWKPVQGRFKDYIAMPKFNLYQSLHTTVVGPQGKPLEVQIRTREMHRRAEFGIAAHWGYKEHASPTDVAWLQRIVDWQSETANPAEFLETLKLDLEHDEVFVFTPKGDVVTLPMGATPIDFAYSIHTDVGHRCIGARVNGRLAPLDSQLRSGETVEVFTSKVPSAGPSRDWLKIVVTPRARNKIRQWFSRERREDAIENGRDELTKALRKEGLRGHRGRARVGQVGGPAGGPRAAGRRPRGAAPHHRPHDHHPPAPVAPEHRGRACGGPRRRHGPTQPLLHPGPRRRDRGLRDPGPRRVGAPGRLRQRHLAGDRPRRPGDRGGVGPRPHGRVRGLHRGEGARPLPAPGRRHQVAVGAPREHPVVQLVHVGRPRVHNALRVRAGRPVAPRLAAGVGEAHRLGVRRLPDPARPGRLTS
jgi:guanosine-3',5'-bis(diphosphate) 3'-pyrophosphohydrolase